MGVTLLTQFIDSIDGGSDGNDGVIIDYHLSNECVVIDGSFLMNTLYKQLNRKRVNDFIYGGNYSAYAKHVKLFFNALKLCNVTPIVVLNGAKFNEFVKKGKVRKDMMKPLIKINKSTQSNEIILPLLMRNVFVEVMHELRVKCYQTTCNADNELAKLANAMECALISGNSNFFIFDLKYGFIPFTSMRWGYSDRNLDSIKCKIYSFERFIDKFDGLKQEMLPIFASIVENDYISRGVFAYMLHNIPTDDELMDTWKEKVNYEQFSHMFVTIGWLRKHDMKFIIDYINDYLKEKIEKFNLNEDLIKKFELSLKSFDISGEESYLMTSRESGFDAVINDIKANIKHLINIDHLPNWYLKQFHSTPYLHPMTMSIFAQKKLFLKPLVEVIDMPSVYDCSQKLLLYICRLLVGDVERIDLTSRIEGQLNVMELETSKCLNESQELENLRNQTNMERITHLLMILEFDHQFINKLEHQLSRKHLSLAKKEIEFWIFAILALKYWISNNNRNTDYLPFMHALLLSVLYEKYGTKPNVEKNFSKFMATTEVNFDRKIVHYFNEFQACILFIEILNSLLGRPLITKCLFFRFLNGKLFHRIYAAFIDDSKNLPSFRSAKPKSLYDKLCQLITKNC